MTYTYMPHIYTDEPPTMKQLLQLMRDTPISAKWFDLGEELLENDTALSAIEANFKGDVDRCCREMFKKWLDTNPNASWSQLFTVLNKVGMGSAAKTVNKQYNYVR